MSDETKESEEQNKGTALAEANLVLEIAFSGLCSFVEHKCAKSPKIDVLLVAARRAKVKEKLCRHHRYLLFRACQLSAVSNNRFYRTFVGIHPEDTCNQCKGADKKPDACRMTAETYCIWDINGYDLTISHDARVNPIELPDDEKKKMLDLDCYQPGRVAARWLSERFPGGLVGSRMRLSEGRLLAGDPVCGKWGMCEEGTPCDKAEAVNICETVICRLETRYGITSVTIHGKGPCRRDRWIQLNPGSKIFISNLCPFEPGEFADDGEPDIIIERDVLAYYELSDEVLSQNKRRIPHLLDNKVTPNKSACPPVVQSAAL